MLPHQQIKRNRHLKYIKMKSHDEVKEIDIKNCICYYFNYIIKIKDFDFTNILINDKSYKNILFCNISYKALFGAKPLRIRFNKLEGFIRVYDETRYLVLFLPGK